MRDLPFENLLERRVEQEADGSWVRGTLLSAVLESRFQHSASAVFHPESGPYMGWIERRPGIFPETDLIRRPAKAGYACALNRQLLPGLGKG